MLNDPVKGALCKLKPSAVAHVHVDTQQRMINSVLEVTGIDYPYINCFCHYSEYSSWTNETLFFNTDQLEEL